jgi:CheY-like chemotaxis protein
MGTTLENIDLPFPETLLLHLFRTTKRSVTMKNVLLVDDDSVFNFLSKEILHRMGLADDIHTALNGKQAIDLFKEYFGHSKPLPDIILLDLNMPIMDGFGFLEAFKKLDLPDKDQVKIIVVTSSNDGADIKRAKDLGVSQYLTKPLEEHSFRKALNLGEHLN